jgi:hypothetical protein
VSVAAEYDPVDVCTPLAEATLGPPTHAGNGTSASVLPAATSSAIQPATFDQPAACQVSNGPSVHPKPQRIARSTSRALSAIAARWYAQ